MKIPLFSRLRRRDTIRAVYGVIVAQARSPVFYRSYGVPDTVNGRLDMLLLHLALALDRIFAEPASQPLGQGIFDLFCQDMDDHLREEGVGDLKVPKQMQKMGEAFYGRRATYLAALKAEDNALLEESLLRNIYSDAADPAASAGGAARLALYVREAEARLRKQDGFEDGKLVWPAPEAISMPSATITGVSA